MSICVIPLFKLTFYIDFSSITIDYFISPFYGYYGVYEIPLGEEDPVTGKKRRYPTLHSVDLRIEKTFNILKGQFAIYADIFNLFNANTATSYYTFDNPQYEQISNRTSPKPLCK